MEDTAKQKQTMAALKKIISDLLKANLRVAFLTEEGQVKQVQVDASTKALYACEQTLVDEEYSL